MLTGAIEAGGTKFVCGVGDATGSRETARIDTRDVAGTLDAVVDFFRAAQERHGAVAGFGIGSFGPLQLDPAAPDFGRITTTPKPGWAGADIPARLRAAFAVPVAIDTDVNAAALAEAATGAGRGARSLAYVTIGTGVGVGLAIDGRTVRGLGHPEAGHLLVRRHPGHGDFDGICPYHGDCLEGLASGPAIIAAWGGSLATLPADHPAWDVLADYIGQLCASLILTVAPTHIVLGGGVMQQARLLEGARVRTADRLAGYCAEWQGDVFDRRITAPGCIEPPGLVGAYMLARAAVAAG
ncbi:ROK family protein [Sphingomonas solaris]|uniref:fructokinase n=1 Tax=Alterirhizorhabdus solaris TaxID=2529389 RepID=A0A558QXF2_9SPHN|nr:ROK family protein [Sphingomonas solaris]TVV71742.1 ROK family protein [Sphingomonas solaris]